MSSEDINTYFKNILSIAGKISINIILIVACLVIPSLISATVKESNPGCYTCGARVMGALGISSIIAMEFVYWSKGITSKQKVIILFWAIALGWGAYGLLELIATFMFLSGIPFLLSASLSFGFVANYIAPMVSFYVSSAEIKRKKEENKKDGKYKFK